jgi:hypothetical protein
LWPVAGCGPLQTLIGQTLCGCAAGPRVAAARVTLHLARHRAHLRDPIHATRLSEVAEACLRRAPPQPPIRAGRRSEPAPRRPGALGIRHGPQSASPEPRSHGRLAGCVEEVNTARLLQRHINNPVAAARKIAKDLREYGAALWTFARVEGVEPTNNAAERAVRKAVLWRKTSFGSASRWGSRFAERMLTVCETLRAQGRSILDFLVGSIESKLLKTQRPSLLPA